MNWVLNHNESSKFAGLAEMALKQNDRTGAKELYMLAAQKEVEALNFLDSTKLRTLAVTVVSAVSLLYKAKEFNAAESLSYQYLANHNLPPFAVEQLQDLLQTIWNEKIFLSHEIEFTKERF